MRERHPVTGRFLAHDCEVDCLVACTGECGVFALDPDEQEGNDD